MLFRFGRRWLSWLLARRSMKKINNIVDRLTTAAAAYYIWRERNNRLFRNTKRPPDILAKEIISTIRYKLMGMKFKNTRNVNKVPEQWNVHGEDLFDYG
ncbi:hypothetical protein Hanom_Chr13g01204121 [Helianthus anomalus]